MGCLEDDLDWGLKEKRALAKETADAANLLVVLALVSQEVESAMVKHPTPFHSAHEGYAIILEELDEAWEEIKANDKSATQEEMVQVAAMAIRFLLEVQ